MSSDFWANVDAFVSALGQQSYYDILRIPRDASPDAITQAFYRWAPQLHPDRFARERDRSRLWQLSQLYARMREAFDVLNDPVKRKQYDQGLARGILRYDPEAVKEAEKPPPLKSDRGRRFYEMGIERLRAGKLDEAEFQLQMALQVEPGAPAAVAALDKVRALKPAPPPQPVTMPAAAAPPTPKLKPRPSDDGVGMPKITFGKRKGAGAKRTAARPIKRARPRAGTPEPIGAGIQQMVPTGDVAPVVGIDFGTTRSSVSVAIGDKVFMLPDQRNRTLHPSVVHYQENGLAICGWDAREMVFRAPRRTVSSPKRLLGKRFSDREVAGFLHSAAYKTVAGPNDAIIVDMGRGVQETITQICAQVVGHVRDLGEKRVGHRIERAVFSVPVGFADAEKAAVTAMARIAGIEVADFIEEPVAAAMAYGFGKNKNEIVAVYDFGGGTFDFTVINMAGYHFEVLARGGDTWLGGDDFDSEMAKTIANALWRATKVDITTRQVEWQRLVFACEKAKRELSMRRETEVVVDKLIEGPKQVNLRQKIGREQLERMCGELFDRSLQICKTAMDQAGLHPADIQRVVASGGVSYIPFVRAGLAEFFGRPIPPAVNPDEAICLGAGFRGAQLSRQPVTGIARM